MALGGSFQTYKNEITEYLISKLPENANILDMGAGCGTYGYYLNGRGYNIEAVEIWKESVEHLKICGLYNKVYESDIRKFNYDKKYDLIIFGDVLEHLSVEDAQKVLEKAEIYTSSILVAVPFLYKQDALGGNEAEIHLQPDLTLDVFNERYPGFELIFGDSGYGYFYKQIETSEESMNNKICVYAICKNEMKFADKWLDNMSEADYICVLDTGSTDGTYEFLKNDPRVTKVVQQEIKPWRFDVARNESMKLVPDDANILVCTDFDELFNKGWAEVVKKYWVDGTYNRIIYLYAWSHNESGEPTDMFKYDKIHNREFYWKFPVHEVLEPKEGVTGKAADVGDLIFLQHYPDKSKSRSNYFDLLKLAVEENPEDSHELMLLAREYLVNNDYEHALENYLKVIDMPDVNKPEKRLVLLESLGRCGDCYRLMGNYDEAQWYYQEWIKEDHTCREPYIYLAMMYNDMNMFTLAECTIKACLEYGKRKNDWTEQADSWVSQPQEILGIVQLNLKKYDEAIENFKFVLQHHPDNPTILKYYSQCLEGKLNNNNSKSI